MGAGSRDPVSAGGLAAGRDDDPVITDVSRQLHLAIELVLQAEPAAGRALRANRGERTSIFEAEPGDALADGAVWSGGRELLLDVSVCVDRAVRAITSISRELLPVIFARGDVARGTEPVKGQRGVEWLQPPGREELQRTGAPGDQRAQSRLIGERPAVMARAQGRKNI